MSAAGSVIGRTERLAQISAYPWNLTRRVFTPEQDEAESLVLGWMLEAGMSARRDPAGNLIGRVEGLIPGGPAVVIGGYVDTAEDASRFEGTLSVLMGIAAVDRLVREGARLRHAVEVIAFVKDAAGRFGSRGFGSRAVVGRFDPGALSLEDPYDVTLRQALGTYGLDPERVEGARRSPDSVITYLEVAAEAGPVLEWAGSPVGIVEGLSETSIMRVTLTGMVGQASTIPMSGRRDALAGAAECIVETERIGSSQASITATVVRIDVDPVPAFVVMGSTTFGVLIASSDDAARRAAVAEVAAVFEGIAGRRRLEISIEHSIDPDAIGCGPGIIRLFEQAVEAHGHPIARLAQGMPTDASNMALLGPIGLALIRCRGGTGWGPAGSVDAADAAVGLDVLSRVVSALASGADAPSLGGTW